MAAVVTQIADAVVTALNAEFPSYTATRTHMLRQTLTDLDERNITVIPTAYLSNTAATRSQDFTEYAVTIIIAERCDTAGIPADSWVSDRVDFVESLWDFLGEPVFTVLSGAYWLDSMEVSVLDSELLQTERVFWSEISLTFRGI